MPFSLGDTSFLLPETLCYSRKLSPVRKQKDLFWGGSKRKYIFNPHQHMMNANKVFWKWETQRGAAYVSGQMKPQSNLYGSKETIMGRFNNWTDEGRFFPSPNLDITLWGSGPRVSMGVRSSGSSPRGLWKDLDSWLLPSDPCSLQKSSHKGRFSFRSAERVFPQKH